MGELVHKQDLKEQVVLVTGGTSGVGKQLILKLVQRGAWVSFCWHSSVEKYDNLVKELLQVGGPGRWIGIKADVGREEDVQNLFEETQETFGQLDAVMNNAALSRDSLLVSLPQETWNEIMATNLNGAFLVCREAVKTFLKHKKAGAILISGSLAHSGTPSNACYSASKGGLLGMMEFIAKHYAADQIRANLVTFGLIDTEMTRLYPETAKQVLIQSSLLKRMASAAEAADLLLYFLTEQATMLNGQNINATNGLTDFPLFHKISKEGYE